MQGGIGGRLHNGLLSTPLGRRVAGMSRLLDGRNIPGARAAQSSCRCDSLRRALAQRPYRAPCLHSSRFLGSPQAGHAVSNGTCRWSMRQRAFHFEVRDLSCLSDPIEGYCLGEEVVASKASAIRAAGAFIVQISPRRLQRLDLAQTLHTWAILSRLAGFPQAAAAFCFALQAPSSLCGSSACVS